MKPRDLTARRPQASADPAGELYALEAEKAPRPRIHRRHTNPDLDPCPKCHRASGDGASFGMLFVVCAGFGFGVAFGLTLLG